MPPDHRSPERLDRGRRAAGGGLRLLLHASGGHRIAIDVDARQATRILILDDDSALVRMAQLALSIEGFDVTTAGDGLEGLECLESGSFDAIVLDLQMPRMDGRTFLRTIRERGLEIPVVVVSAYEAAMAKVELGANAAIKKPFEPEVLVGALRQLTAAPTSVS